MLCSQLDTLMLHSPSYSSTHGLWDELHNLVVIGLQLSSTALAANYNKVPLIHPPRAALLKFNRISR